MHYLQFDELDNYTIETALIDAITLDTYTLEVIIGKQLYRVRINENNNYYATSLHQVHDDIQNLNINKIYLHECVNFHPSLGFKGEKDKDILLDKHCKPIRHH